MLSQLTTATELAYMRRSLSRRWLYNMPVEVRSTDTPNGTGRDTMTGILELNDLNNDGKGDYLQLLPDGGLLAQRQSEQLTTPRNGYTGSTQYNRRSLLLAITINPSEDAPHFPSCFELVLDARDLSHEA